MSGLAEAQADADRARGDGALRLAIDRASSQLAGHAELARAHRTLAAAAFLRDADIDGFHHHMHLAARARQRFFACVRAGLRCPEDHPLRDAGAALEEALAGGDGGLVSELAALAVASERPLAAALGAVILGREDAVAALARFEAALAPGQEGHAMMLTAILRSDEAAFARGLEAALEARRGTPSPGVNEWERWLAVDLIGLARLARRQGLAVNVADARVPAELCDAPRAAYPDAASLWPALPRAIVDDLPRAS